MQRLYDNSLTVGGVLNIFLPFRWTLQVLQSSSPPLFSERYGYTRYYRLSRHYRAGLCKRARERSWTMDDLGLEGLTESVHARAGEAPGWAPPHDWRTLRPGDHYTIAGVYRRRTWWEWLTLAPRPLQVWYVRKVQP